MPPRLPGGSQLLDQAFLTVFFLQICFDGQETTWHELPQPACDKGARPVPILEGLLSQRRRSARLISERLCKADAGVGQQRIDWPAADGRAQLVGPSVDRRSA